MRPKIWGLDGFRGTESNDLEDGDIMIGVVNGEVRLAVREGGEWVPESRAQLLMKESGTTRGAALAIDPDLRLMTRPGMRLAIRGRIYFDMVAGFRWRHVGPPGSAMRMRRSWLTYADTAEQGMALDQEFSTGDLVIAAGGGGVIALEGIVMVGATPGPVGFAWAASVGTQAVVRAGSFLEYRRV